ncbi:S-layer homology domain-containing protein [Ammonifex thiophilus]|uniref:SLH domain-containing protein n=1 Tax=Ammonifex thiophilus TaxID=444093 RepID=A0A3D8P0Y8_9THEO|nr:S-layer homology domain-containing protein [Ammonifex thiophilus]RDV80902.1 hypothetical protein DXX99_10335 [Ammonifex thiophilus]
MQWRLLWNRKRGGKSFEKWWSLSVVGFLMLLFLLHFVSRAWAVNYSYDPLGRLISADYATGQKVTYSYDPGGNLLRVTFEGTPVLLEGLKVHPETLSLTVGQGVGLTVTAVYSDGTEADVTGVAGYSSGDEGVARVEPGGKVVAVGPGKTLITVTWSGLTGRATVTVVPASGGGGGAAIIRPSVTTSDPADGTRDVPVDKVIKLGFNTSIQKGDGWDRITLKDASGREVKITASVIEESFLVVKPEAELAYGTTYTLTVPANAVKSATGYGLSSGFTLTFTTAKEPEKPGKPEQPKPKFKDMAGHWAEKVVLELAAKGLVAGYPDGTFKPDNPITRAEAAALLVRTLKPAPATGQDLLALSRKMTDAQDIPSWAREVAAVAVREGLVKGDLIDGKLCFAAERKITRLEMALFLVRALKQKEVELGPGELSFADAGEVPAWAKGDLALAVGAGLVRGYPDGTFKPAKPVTRAEAAAMISRLLEELPSR